MITTVRAKALRFLQLFPSISFLAHFQLRSPFLCKHPYCKFHLLTGTLLLEDTRERAIVGNTYFDSPMPGIYIVRGENLTLIGELVSC